MQMEALLQDLRFGLRLLLKSPGFAAMAVAALALGIGANTSVFSVVHGVLLKPLPYPDPDRLVAIYDTQPALKTAPASYPKYIDWRDQNNVFEVIGGTTVGSAVLTGDGEPEQLWLAQPTASFFRVFAMPPLLGRWFTEEEDSPGGPKVVILSEGFWERRFGRDPGVIDSTLVLNDVPRTVVGVMPEGLLRRPVSAFVPLAREYDESTRGQHFLQTFGRLKPGVTVAQAQSEMVALGHRLAQEHNHNHGIDVRAYRYVVIGDSRTPLLVLLACVTFVLLIACANVANLLLARAASRSHEIALRAALGAGRLRLARQLLTESLLLSAAGGAFGLLLAHFGVQAFVAGAPPVLPRMDAIALDTNVLVFTLLIALLTGSLFGLAPVLHARRQGPAAALQEQTGRTAGGRATRRTSSAIVVAEVALTIVLLVGAGLMVKSLDRLNRQDTGFTTERLLTFDISLPPSRYGSEDQVRRFYGTLLERMSSLPGVEAAGATSHLPLDRYGSNGYFQIEGRSPWAPGEAPLAELRVIDGDYFKALGIPLVGGRLFGTHERNEGRSGVLINQAMASRFWPDEDPVGQRVQLGGDLQEVIGVIGSVRSYNPALPPMFEMSRSMGQVANPTMTVVVRSMGADPGALAAAIRQEVAAIDPALPLARLQTMEEVFARSLARPRLMSTMVSGFAVLAAMLAFVGVYGLIAYAVSQQRRELGIRMAIGADPATVFRMVLGRGLRLAVAGIAIGGLAAVALTRLMTSMLYEVEPTDPWVFAAACAGVLIAAVLASYFPARAATRVDPTVTLRST
jgi:putative ABC transport system permease protein